MGLLIDINDGIHTQRRMGVTLSRASRLLDQHIA